MFSFDYLVLDPGVMLEKQGLWLIIFNKGQGFFFFFLSVLFYRFSIILLIGLK